jgi:tRNA-dihydrouridine synthase
MRKAVKMDISLAPMEGITTYIFRNAIDKYYGGIDRYYTPFITASHLKGRELRDVCPENNQGMRTIPQILTNDAELFLLIVKQLAAIGYREVNLNLGCPSGTVVGKGRGSGFLAEPEKLDKFLYQIFEGRDTLEKDINDKIKFSIKTRLGKNSLTEWDEVLKVYIKYPIDELIIHPRLRKDFYTGEVHLDEFKKGADMFRARDEENPDSFATEIIYNGDIVDLDSYKRLAEKVNITEENPIMIGRGLIMNPNLANELKAGETEEFDKRKFKEFINEIKENYIEEMSGEKQVVMKMKGLWAYFGEGLGLDKKKMKEIYKANRLAEYTNAITCI